MASPHDLTGPTSGGAAADGSPGSELQLVTAYGDLQSLLLDSPDVTAFLQQAVQLAASVIPRSSCGITVRRDHAVTTVAASDDLATQVDEIQYGREQGPCLESLDVGRPVRVDDLAADHRWAEYRIHALTYGVRSSLSLPLAVDGVVRGALNLYLTEPHGVTDQVVERGEAFARQLATALTLVLRTADQAALEDQLREALVTRAIIDQAVGILMGQRRVNAVEAFAVLREVSQTRNRKLRQVAVDLVQSVTGQPPVAPRPFASPR